ncbi:hypothetical protein THOM_0434, partial [Trachipleistophora hominis]
VITEYVESNESVETVTMTIPPVVKTETISEHDKTKTATESASTETSKPKEENQEHFSRR